MSRGANPAILLPQLGRPARRPKRNAKRSGKKKAGRRRRNPVDDWVDEEIDSWVEGELQEIEVERGTDVADVMDAIWDGDTEALEEAAQAFTDLANEVLDAWVAANPDKSADLIQTANWTTDGVAWNTWAHIKGHGVGFGDDMEQSDWESLEATLDADERLSAAAQTLQDEIWNVTAIALDKLEPEAMAKRYPPVDPYISLADEMEIINRHRARLGMRPLDPEALGWEPADVEAEAQRIRALNPRGRRRKNTRESRVQALRRRLLP